MINDILIISDNLIEPPSEILAVRTITMMVHCDLNMNIILQSTQEMKDAIYHFAKPKGLMDYVDYILNEVEVEDGIRINIIKKHPNTIVVKAIRLENQLPLLGRIKILSGR